MITTQGKINLNEFLKFGAFYRDAAGLCHIWQGQAGSGPFEDSKKISFCNFFDSNLLEIGFTSGRIEIEVSDLRARLMELDHKSVHRSDFKMPEMSDFHISYQEVLSKIHRGELEKAVPIVAALADRSFDVANLAFLLNHILEAPANFHVFGFWGNGKGILGATPEVLFEKSAGLLQTMALAGTCPKEETESRLSLLQDPKELHEHKLVVDDIWQRLSLLGNVQVSKTEIVELPTLLHLKTKLQVHSNRSDSELVKLLHPTPALGVSPRNYGIRWMENLPYQKDRKVFGGPVVFPLGQEKSMALVAIRSLQWNDQGIWIGAGCGLVSASQLEQEWHELNMKLKSIFQLFGIR